MAFVDDTNPLYVARRNAMIADAIALLQEDVTALMPLATGWQGAAVAALADPVLRVICHRLYTLDARLKALEAFIYKS
jgi:hypothetical protein